MADGVGIYINPDGTVSLAPGYRWCPYCNGEGVVVTMSPGPHLGEYAEECGFCENGVVKERSPNG